MPKYTIKDYPLYDRHRDDIHTTTGKKLDEFTLEEVLNGGLSPEDCRISAETLEKHAQIEESAGNFQMAAELRKSAEMTRIPDNRIMQIYNALRPRMSTRENLYEIVNELESQYDATRCAEFIRDAIRVYEKRNMFR